MKKLRGQRIQVVRSGHVTTLDDPTGEYRLDAPQFRGQLRRGQVVFFDGPLFRDREGFPKHASQLRAFFTPLADYRRNVSDLMRSIRQTADVVVGVHIRRGESYRTFRQGRHYHAPAQFLPLMRGLEAPRYQVFDIDRAPSLGEFEVNCG